MKQREMPPTLLYEARANTVWVFWQPRLPYFMPSDCVWMIPNLVRPYDEDQEVSRAS
jgi:hypothetical protein